MQAAVRDKEQEIRRLQAASGGASEAEMAAAVAAKEAALKAAAQLQADAAKLAEQMQGLQSKARELQAQLEAQGEQLRAETKRADEAAAAAAAGGGADQEAMAKLRGELDASQAAQRTYREESAVAKMALERRVKDLENSLEASRKEQETSRRELEDARKRAAASSGAEGGAAAELGEVRALLEQAEAQAAEERAAAAAAAAAAAEREVELTRAQGELAKLTKLTAELTQLTQAQAELDSASAPVQVSSRAAQVSAATQFSRPASGIGRISGALEPGGGVPPALAEQLVAELAAAAGAAEAMVTERLAACEVRVGAALSQLSRARDQGKRMAGRLRAETRRAEVAEAAAAAGGGGDADAIATEARLRAAALAEAEAEARARDLAIEIAELRRSSAEEVAAAAGEIAELRAAAEARAAADALAAASPFKQWEAAPEAASPEPRRPPPSATDTGEAAAAAAAALEKLTQDLRRVKRERFWVRCLVVSLSHTVELCKEELEGSQQQASQGAAALQQASDQLLQEQARLEAMAGKHAQLQQNLELAVTAAANAAPPPAPEAEAWRSFCAELSPETKLQADSRQLEQGASNQGTVWNPDTSLTGGVVWVCPGGDTLEISFLGSSPPDGGSSPPRATSPLLEQHPSLNPAAAAIQTREEKTRQDIAAAASAAGEDEGEYAWVSREARLERRGSLMSLMTAAAPVDGGSSVGAKEQVSALLGASLHGATLVHEGQWSKASNGRSYSVCSQVRELGSPAP